MAEINDAPVYLRAQIALVTQWQNRMIVGLRDGAAVAIVSFATELVGRNDARGGFRVGNFEPSHQRRPEVETQVGVVVYDALDLALAVNDARVRVRAVALRVDALVPVMRRTRALFALDRSGPRIFARRLIEMAMNDDRGHDLLWGPRLIIDAASHWKDRWR